MSDRDIGCDDCGNTQPPAQCVVQCMSCSMETANELKAETKLMLDTLAAVRDEHGCDDAGCQPCKSLRNILRSHGR